jgi:hypothetical protein
MKRGKKLRKYEGTIPRQSPPGPHSSARNSSEYKVEGVNLDADERGTPSTEQNVLDYLPDEYFRDASDPKTSLSSIHLHEAEDIEDMLKSRNDAKSSVKSEQKSWRKSIIDTTPLSQRFSASLCTFEDMMNIPPINVPLSHVLNNLKPLLSEENFRFANDWLSLDIR